MSENWLFKEKRPNYSSDCAAYALITEKLGCSRLERFSLRSEQRRHGQNQRVGAREQEAAHR